MSFPEYRLILSPKAQQDVEDILQYTGEKWGESQVPIYHNKLNRALESILADPSSGQITGDLSESHLVYPVGSHVIVYRLQANVIGVVRILHKRMSLPLHV